MNHPAEHTNQLPAYDNDFLMQWLTEPVQGPKVVTLVRDLALATRVLGTEVETQESEEHIARKWNLLTNAGDKLALTFTSKYAGEYPVRNGIYTNYELRMETAEDQQLVLRGETRAFDFGSKTPSQAHRGISMPIRDLQYVEGVRNELLRTAKVYDAVTKYGGVGLA